MPVIQTLLRAEDGSMHLIRTLLVAENGKSVFKFWFSARRTPCCTNFSGSPRPEGERWQALPPSACAEGVDAHTCLARRAQKRLRPELRPLR